MSAFNIFLASKSNSSFDIWKKKILKTALMKENIRRYTNKYMPMLLYKWKSSTSRDFYVSRYIPRLSITNLCLLSVDAGNLVMSAKCPIRFKIDKCRDNGAYASQSRVIGNNFMSLWAIGLALSCWNKPSLVGNKHGKDANGVNKICIISQLWKLIQVSLVFLVNIFQTITVTTSFHDTLLAIQILYSHFYV